MDVLDYALEHGCSYDRRETLITAAMEGRVNVFACVHYYLEPTAEEMVLCTSYALRAGHMCIVRWLHEEWKSELRAEHLAIAVEKKNVTMFAYLYEHGCPMERDLPAQAAAQGSVRMLIRMQELGMVLGTTTREAADTGKGV